MGRVLQLKDVSKHYKNGGSITEAVKDISYTLDEGHSMAIIGPSGSGKSTILNIMGGLDKPSKGSVIINGKEITRFKDKELSEFRNKTIGFIFQFFNLQDYLNVQENVMIPMLIAGKNIKEAKQKSEELLEKVGMGKRIKYYPKQLSGGEMQRVAVARSLANDPKIILADEPTANLDRENSTKILDLFDVIIKNGVSFVVITHDPWVSKRFEKVLEIHDGRIKEQSN